MLNSKSKTSLLSGSICWKLHTNYQRHYRACILETAVAYCGPKFAKLEMYSTILLATVFTSVKSRLAYQSRKEISTVYSVPHLEYIRLYLHKNVNGIKTIEQQFNENIYKYCEEKKVKTNNQTEIYFQYWNLTYKTSCTLKNKK